MNKRKMAFFEINKGRLAEEMQRAFENCQAVTHDIGLPTEVTLKINIIPAAKNDKFGQVSYSIAEKHPPKKSIKFTTELTGDGIIIADGKSAVEILQEELQFEEKESQLKIAK